MAESLKEGLEQDKASLENNLGVITDDYLQTFKDDGAELAYALTEEVKNRLREFYDWWQILMTLKRNIEHMCKVEMKLSTDIDYGIPVIDAEMSIRSAFDYAGHAIKEGITCP